MKLNLDSADGRNLITGHGPGWVAVNRQPINSSLLVTPNRIVTPWTQVAPKFLTLADFAPMLDWQVAFIVFGSGPRFVFPPQELIRAFAARGVGFEVMDTPAACRTYNVLSADGRDVVAALLV